MNEYSPAIPPPEMLNLMAALCASNRPPCPRSTELASGLAQLDWASITLAARNTGMLISHSALLRRRRRVGCSLELSAWVRTVGSASPGRGAACIAGAQTSSVQTAAILARSSMVIVETVLSRQDRSHATAPHGRTTHGHAQSGGLPLDIQQFLGSGGSCSSLWPRVNCRF